MLLVTFYDTHESNGAGIHATPDTGYVSEEMLYNFKGGVVNRLIEILYNIIMGRGQICALYNVYGMAPK